MTRISKWLESGIKDLAQAAMELKSEPPKKSVATTRKHLRKKLIKKLDLLNDNNKLVNKFAYHGIYEPDDMVDILIICTSRWTHNQPLKFNEEVRNYRQLRLPPGTWDCGLKC